MSSGRDSRVPSSAQDPCDLLAGADRDDHHRYLRVAPEEARPLAHAVGGAVDAEQHRRTGDAPAVKQVAHGDERRRARDPLLASNVDRELRRLVQLLWQRDRPDLAGQHPRPLQGDQAVTLDRDDLLEQVLDSRSRIDRHRHQREILRQREYPVRAKPVLQPEALRATQHHADLNLLAPIQVEQRVGDELLLGSMALAEIRGELQAIVVHT